MFSIDNKPRWKNYSKLRGMLHFWVDSESKHFGYCNCLGHAPHAEKNTFCSSHWYLEDKKGWGGLQLHDYDELSMNYRWTTAIVWSCMNNLSIILIMSPLRCLAVCYMLFWGIHISGTKAGDRVTHEMDCTLQWYAVVCCCLPKQPSLAGRESLHLSKWKRSKMKLEKQGRNPWPSFHIPARNEILGPGPSKLSLQC